MAERGGCHMMVVILWVQSLSLFQTPCQFETSCLLDSTRPGGHIDEDNDDQHHDNQSRKDYSGHLLSGFLHGLLTLLLVLGCFFFWFAFELPHDVSTITHSVYLLCSQEPDTQKNMSQFSSHVLDKAPVSLKKTMDITQEHFGISPEPPALCSVIFVCMSVPRFGILC